MIIKNILLGIIITLSAAAITYYFIPPQIPLSPAGDTSPTTVLGEQKNNYLVFGFVPYWNLKKTSSAALNSITHYAYFALHLNSQGEIYKKVNNYEEEPGFTNYKRVLASNPSNLVLTFMQADQDSLHSILNNPESRKRATTNILNSVKESKAVGINIDFEPTTDISTTLRANFTKFITELHNSLAPSDNILLTISIYPSAASRPRLWDLPALTSSTDYFVVMTYDYTLPSSPNSGPNSPLRDQAGNFEHNILKNLNQLTTVVPPTKILLGIPLYGYEWETLDDTKYSPAQSRGVTASLERIDELISSGNLTTLWDRNTLTPYGISTSSGSTSQIYFENEASIRLKLELVQSANLGGIALWAIGYEGDTPWLWPLIKSLK